METRRDERINRLLQALKRSDKIHLKEASQLLGVSEMTIRRDLNSEPGQVVLLGGYVMLEPRSAGASHYLLSDEKTRQVEEKRHAARLAAQHVEPHQTVFFDCGTTTPYIIDALDDELPFTGLCYSLNTFLALQDKPNCRVILSGGEFHASNAIFKPINFQECLGNICPDIAFLSAAGVHLRHGATCFNLDELPVKHWALSMAQRNILVVDDTKFGKVRAACMGPLTAFETIISNRPPAAEFIDFAAAENLTLKW
ncbi:MULTISPECIES: DNA-binding transcriptional repressor DeoR [Cedecea]|jgi:DeoR family deoxyribose operon repressor|uniref:DeoR faimly transcriptional regulator n=1 Tax=Cedecea neteri TaxID=158822 RepID=A0A089RK67_9ENTR|nr:MULTISPECIES: DNA-binding transcriptional repressor DeoR [Cedecea]AIR06835.1 DeoR faimly transcriptional regulator [Cedecea neteri]NWC62835.1 DNA-binding transcriptional repressor DeoR [Cedecea sp. P7760]